MSETALVTGACGFTGTKLVEQLLDANWDVVATDLTETDRGQFYTETDNAPHPAYDPTFVNEHEDVPFYPADITERETLEPIFESHAFDVVFHPASLFDYFADCLLVGRDPYPDGHHALVDVQVIEAVYESAESGRRISLD